MVALGALLAAWCVVTGPRAAVAPAMKGDAKPLAGLLIAVDAGHGGQDSGVCYFPDDLIEKEINLDMAFRLRDALQAAGADVLLTRSDDRFVPLDERAGIANQAQADLFISLHVNQIPGHPECFGAQTFYFPNSQPAESLARSIQEELLAVDPENYRQIQPGEYKVLRLTNMPGVIVEIGFMTNARDRELLQGDEYRDAITGAIVAGIVKYVQRGSAEAPPS